MQDTHEPITFEEWKTYTPEQQWQFVELSEKLHHDDRRVLLAIPECLLHGECIPHALEWIEESKKIRLQQDSFMRALKALLDVDLNAYIERPLP